MQEPRRGTLCSVGAEEHCLFTTGHVPYWTSTSIQGPTCRPPIQIGSVGETDIRARAREMVAFSKMNWAPPKAWRVIQSRCRSHARLAAS
jgi:hypothetical protein